MNLLENTRLKERMYYKAGKITLEEAAEFSRVSLRRMLDILAEHGVKGNVKMVQQIKARDYAKSL